jgi:hypothetical protein
MGRMARKAALFTGNRSMVDRDFFTLFFMAVKTEGVPLFEDKLRIFGSVGPMTGITRPLFERRMINLPASLQFGSVMTVVAKLASCFGRPKRFWI